MTAGTQHTERPALVRPSAPENRPLAGDALKDTRSLAEHEEVIERGLATFIGVGNSLRAIRASKLYMESGYATFEGYCTGRWKISRSRGYQLIAAATTVEALARDLPASTIVDTPLPVNEAQVRALNVAPEPERAAVWGEAVARAGGDQPTAATIADVVTATSIASTPTEDELKVRDCFVDADLSDDASTAEGRLRDAGGERAPERFPRRRSPITKTAERLAGDMVAMARRIDRFLADDRVRQQRDVLRPILCKAISVLEYVGQYHLDVTLTLGDGAYAEWVDREIEGGTWLGQVVA